MPRQISERESDGADFVKEGMRYIEEVVPFVEDDVEVFSLVASTMKKMRSISDMEFSRLDLKPYQENLCGNGQFCGGRI